MTTVTTAVEYEIDVPRRRIKDTLDEQGDLCERVAESAGCDLEEAAARIYASGIAHDFIGIDNDVRIQQIRNVEYSG